MRKSEKDGERVIKRERESEKEHNDIMTERE